MLCHTFAAFIMWSEFRSSGILDDLVRWQSLSTFISSLAFISACWSFVFPELYLDLRYPLMKPYRS